MNKRNLPLKITLIIMALAMSVLCALVTGSVIAADEDRRSIASFFGLSHVGNVWVKLFFCMSCLLALALLVYGISFIITCLRARNEELRKLEDKKETVCRFESLSDIDRKMTEYKVPVFNNGISLSEICDDFRNFAAYKYGLYYDIMTVRSFIAALPVTRMIIMQGISGTGKTSLAWAFGEYIGKSSTIVPVQPSWKEKSDLLGYFNEFTDRFNETEFLRRIYESLYNKNVNIIVLDEMNIARVEYYFAEFLSLLEIRQSDGRYIRLTSGGWQTDPQNIIDGKIRLPDNMWYIGTANNDDSTMAISDKVYDRAMVLDLDRRAEPFTAPATESTVISYKHIMSLGENARKQYRISDKNISNISSLDKYLSDNLGISFGNRIMRQIEEYVPVYVSAGGTENEAIDIMVSRKVLRKLESGNPMHIRRCAESFNQCLDGLFGDSELPLSRRAFEKYCC